MLYNLLLLSFLVFVPYIEIQSHYRSVKKDEVVDLIFEECNNEITGTLLGRKVLENGKLLFFKGDIIEFEKLEVGIKFKIENHTMSFDSTFVEKVEAEDGLSMIFYTLPEYFYGEIKGDSLDLNMVIRYGYSGTYEYTFVSKNSGDVLHFRE